MAASALLGPLAAALLLAAGEGRAGVAPAGAAAAAPPETLRFTRTVFASGRDLPAPVAFTVDDRGAVYTAHSLRFAGHGLFDVRAYRRILAEDWTLTSVAARRAATERWVRAGLVSRPGAVVTLDTLARYSEQVRRLEDRDGDGRAESVRVFAAGMNELERGAAAGVLTAGGRVYATIIPDLLAWDDSAGSARRREVLQSGFGVHMGQGGHDLHGLTLGLDGRLYWSIGDRGYAFTTREGLELAGHSGAVFRCWPDGSGLERYATGLRNPQELAFDDHGDLFTGDNNADVGDHSRLLYVPEGSDAGWSYFLQFIPACGPWLREHHWEPAFPAGDPARPAWVLPPAAEAGSCPAGFAAYPGTGLPARYDGTLWLADFVGGVDAYRMVPEGAGFRLGERLPGYHDSWSTCDVDFAPDGRLFVLYWGESWQPSDRSRLVALTPAVPSADSTRVREVRELLARGAGSLDDARLSRLLEHPDRRLRQRASLELARRGRADLLARVLAGAGEPRARLHALWGLGALAHARPDGGEDALLRPAVLGALSQPDAEVRRVAAVVLGETADSTVTPELAACLTDASPRVRFAAAQALARAGDARAHPALLAFLARDGGDPLQRMAAARALAHVSPPARLAELIEHADRGVRLGAVLALREAGAPEVAVFLADRDVQVACEAARAAYDLELAPARQALVATLPGLRPELRIEPYLRRALHAALREGTPGAAAAVAGFAAEAATGSEWREEALRVLAQWDHPEPRDGVWGRWEPQPPRPAGIARAAVEPVLEQLFARSDGDALLLAVRIASEQRLRVSSATFLRWVRDASLDDGLRVSAFGWLTARGGAEARLAEAAALASSSDTLYAAALAAVLGRDARQGVAFAQRTLARAATTTAVRQAAVRTVARDGSPEARAFIRARWDELAAGRLPLELALEVTEAAGGAHAASLADAAEPRGGPGRFTVALQGGDAERGRRLFEEHEGAACLRCHTLDGRGGTTGPDLSVVGTHDRAYLLESLVAPEARLAPGFARSGMPPMGEVLTLAQLRDLVEYLATRRDRVPDVALGALATEAPATGRGCLRVDRSCAGSRLVVAGLEHANGVSVAAPSRLEFAVPAGSRAFVGRAGLDDAAGRGTLELQARVDGRLVWSSGPLRAGRLVRLHVPLPAGAQRLELRVLDRETTAEAAVADWVEAGFVR